jgi:hypothetical protein
MLVSTILVIKATTNTWSGDLTCARRWQSNILHLAKVLLGKDIFPAKSQLTKRAVMGADNVRIHPLSPKGDDVANRQHDNRSKHSPGSDI